MKKTFEFGKIDYNGNGRPENLVTVDVELKETGRGEEFTASAMIWNRSKTDALCGGQCLDEVKHFIKNNKIFNFIFEMWKKYHLNGMRPTCEHQRALNWEKLAGESVEISHYWLTDETRKQKREIEEKIKKQIEAKGSAKITPQEQKIFKLNLWLDLTEQDEKPQGFLKYYYKKDSETKARGWIRCDEHKEGILCKPCPVCGYKYGTSWNMETIPAEDLEKIKKLIEGRL